MKKKTIKKGYHSLFFGSILVGILASALGLSLKAITEIFEELLLEKLEHVPVFFIISPVIGIILIYLFRKFFFKGKKNKGIKEVFKLSINGKIHSHFLKFHRTTSTAFLLLYSVVQLEFKYPQ